MRLISKYKINRVKYLIRHDRKWFIKLTLYFPLRIKFVRRARFWFRLLRRLQGTTIKFEAGLILSAVIDTLKFSFCRGLALSPKISFSAVVRCKKLDYCLMVRAGTDDIYHAFPRKEGEVHDVICDSLAQGDIFVDVGANIGYYTVLASNIVGVEGAVIAFEPIPDTFSCLKTNCEINQLTNIEAIPKAVWSTDSNLKLHVPGGYYGQASIKKNSGDAVTVGSVSLDQICMPYDKIRLLKIDAEGSEYEILKGAPLILAKTDLIVIECGDDYRRIVKLLSKDFVIRKLSFTSYILAQNKVACPQESLRT